MKAYMKELLNMYLDCPVCFAAWLIGFFVLLATLLTL